MYNDENNLYHGNGDSYPRDDYQPRQDLVHPAAQPQAEQTAGSSGTGSSQTSGGHSGPAPKKKPSLAMKITAMCLACAVIGGACGFGGAVLADNLTGGTVINQSKRETTTVEVQQVDGKTLMTPAEVYASTVNSVVSINVSSVTTNVFGQTTQASSGSGFIITQDGYIATNYHVVEGATSIEVTLYNGDTYQAKLVGGDSDYDLAVLKIDAEGLSPVTLGDSTKINVGDTVMAIGNPLGELTFSQSVGTVSSANRAINVDGTPFNMIQVDASINPGNSGGPLMNLYGEVIGIVSAKYSSYADTTVEGLGFAIPISDVQALLVDIMENGQITNKPYLAITGGTMTEQMAAQFQIDLTEGVFVYSVEEGGAGDRAGLQLGDVITQIEDTKITSMSDLTAVKKQYKAGDTVTVTYYRQGQSYTTELTFDEQPVEEQQEQVIENSYSSGGQYGQGNLPDIFGDIFG